jgi:hypothetical protein
MIALEYGEFRGALSMLTPALETSLWWAKEAALHFQYLKLGWIFNRSWS